MRLFRRIVFLLLVVGAVVAVCFKVPCTVTVRGPQKVRVLSLPEGMQVDCVAGWKDLRLRQEYFQQTLHFDAPGSGTFALYAIPTSVAASVWRAFLIRQGRWTTCLNCYGPHVRFSVRPTSPYTPPPRTQWFVKERTVGDEAQFIVDLMPDENAFDERPFVMRDREALMRECETIISLGRSSHVPPETFGPELKHLAPVRVQTDFDSVTLWMGGKVHYWISPRSSNDHGKGRGSIMGMKQVSEYAEQAFGFF
jgi:hypothetical protein